jgi:DnaJ-class molecular chaperone
MSGNLPPGCTQQMCDEAQPGYWDPPQQWEPCPACCGEGGFEVSRPQRDDPYFAVWETCENCAGVAGWLCDAEGD